MRAAGAAPDARLAETAPASLFELARSGASDAAVLDGLLASAVRERWVTRPPAGAHWANDTGCGEEVEGVEPTLSFACGMAMSPALSSRFLHFYVEE